MLEVKMVVYLVGDRGSEWKGQEGAAEKLAMVLFLGLRNYNDGV